MLCFLFLPHAESTCCSVNNRSIRRMYDGLSMIHTEPKYQASSQVFLLEEEYCYFCLRVLRVGVGMLTPCWGGAGPGGGRGVGKFQGRSWDPMQLPSWCTHDSDGRGQRVNAKIENWAVKRVLKDTQGHWNVVLQIRLREIYLKAQ